MSDNTTTPLVAQPIRPPTLTVEQEELCRRLDALREGYGTTIPASEMFRGAVFASKPEARINPDWMAQTAHSLREILYKIWDGKKRKRAALKQAGSVRAEDDAIVEEVGNVYGRLTAICHHEEDCSADEFEQLFYKFQQVMRKALARQLDIHGDIDKFLASGVEGD